MAESGEAVICEARENQWLLRSDLFSLQLGVTGTRQLAVFSWRNERTGTEWVKAPVPFFGFCIHLNGHAIDSFSPSNNCGAFVLEDARHFAKGQVKELHFRLRHQPLGLIAILILRAFDGTAALETEFVLRNEGTESVWIEGLSPLNLTLHPPSALRLLTLTGGRYDDRFPPSSFALTERDLNKSAVQISCGAEGRSSAQDLPWFALGLLSPDGAVGEGLVGGLQWSGRWQGVFQEREGVVSAQMSATEVRYELTSGSELHSPVATVLLFTGDWDEAGWQWHCWQERFLCPPAPQDFPWVQYNSWFGWTTQIDEAILRREVEIAAELGCEVFVVDAGWYEGCGAGDFGHGLGTWKENRQKFPDGLRNLSDLVHKKGMRFGLWVEPERVDVETELAKQHPDWFARRDGRVIGGGRYAHLCFGNPAVVAWFKERLAEVVADYQVDWLKWDYNIAYGLGCNDPSHGHQAGDGTYAHTVGVYEVKDYLRHRFPHLVIEGCASGGNRIDFGLLKRVHTYWLSDFTHRSANVRFHLTGAWFALPPRYLNSWVVHEETDLTAFRSRMGGAFGISSRLAHWDAATLERAKQSIAEYKQLRPYVLKRRFLLTPQANSLQEWTVWQFYDPGRDQGVLMAFREQAPEDNLRIKLKGLQGTTHYECYCAETGERLVRLGSELMTEGIVLKVPEVGGSTLWWVQPSKS